MGLLLPRVAAAGVESVVVGVVEDFIMGSSATGSPGCFIVVVFVELVVRVRGKSVFGLVVVVVQGEGVGYGADGGGVGEGAVTAVVEEVADGD